ncbi:anti-sigma factor [Winogradskyella alexanderae]|uniref:Anti-sigma factor n=1 Tax=Winogradskyella alexanderae TaxID=2877123 RepID=A0ABS7XUI1_9FLAO|nr:anti-sigma factor [Winogradskyella alexanderae]MCA0133700.1 anti-sigma factor [Winogradskyella alexanderae]
MMDKKMILENGLLEQYVLGELDLNKRAEIEKVLASDSELKAELYAIEKDFETLGLENAIAPPVQVKSNLMQFVASTSNSNTNDSSKKARYLLGVAASIATLLLIGSFWMYSQLNDVQQQLKTVESKNGELNNTIDQLNNNLNRNNALFATLSHPDTEQYILKGNALMPEGKLISYVNHTTKSVVINAEKLPELDADHDYQMWADVEGEMINMGVISKNEKLLAMNYIDQAESLNITIEAAGGNDHPTVSRLVTNVYLN